MKILFSLAFALLFSVRAIAQDPTEGHMNYNGEERNGVIATYDAPKSATEDALEQKLKSSNLGKQHHEHGYWKYEGVTWPEISSSPIDVYFNVESGNNKSVVGMLVSTGDGNFVTSANNPQIIEGMKAFLNRFNADVIAWQQQLAIAAQQKAVSEANHDLKRADHETDRAIRRQKKADRNKEKKQKDVDEENKKLQQLQQPK